MKDENTHKVLFLSTKYAMVSKYVLNSLMLPIQWYLKNFTWTFL